MSRRLPNAWRCRCWARFLNLNVDTRADPAVAAQCLNADTLLN